MIKNIFLASARLLDALEIIIVAGVILMVIAASFVYFGLAATPAGNSPATSTLLSYAVVNLIFWGIVLSAAAVFVVRRFGSKWVWRGWAAFLVISTTLGTVAFQRSFPVGAGSPAISVFMLAIFVGIPTAVIALTAARINRRTPARPWLGHFARTFAAFLISIPPALVIGAIPDIARMF